MELANLDWNSLGFGYLDTDYNVRCYYKDGKWGSLEVTDKKTLDLHMAATCLHYGQECFEGLKAFRGKDVSSVCKPEPSVCKAPAAVY